MFFILILLVSCGKKQEPPKVTPPAKPSYPKTQLSIYGLKYLRTSGLEGTLIKEFSTANNCDVILTLFDNTPELLSAVNAESNAGKIDVVMTLDNAFTSDETLRSLFLPLAQLSTAEISRDLLIDPAKRLIPYGYANLGIVYNSKVFPQGPQSFGELQDAKYFRQMAISDPHSSAEGRCLLFWSLALFGENGYEFLWKSLRKNVRNTFPDYRSTLEQLQSGKCNMIIGYNSTPAWLAETGNPNKDIKFISLKEGAYQYSELAGIPITSLNTEVAVRFIQYLISASAQKMVLYKLGLFPANAKTSLPVSFARIPVSSYTVNRRLSEADIAEHLETWLSFWSDLFNYRLTGDD